MALIECPECGGKVLDKAKKYSHICEKCGRSTEYDSSKMFDGVIKQLKALGVTVR